MQILIPAGGRGTRLRPLTDFRPKPLLPLGGRPILSRIIDGIPVDYPITVIVTREVADLFLTWKDEFASSLDVRIHIEKDRETGPAGPVSAIADYVQASGVDEDLLIMMGDSTHPFSISEFLSTRRMRCAHISVYCLPDIQQASRFGVTEIAGDGTLTAFEEKPARPRSPWVFTGCLYLPRHLLELLPRVADRSPQMGHLVSECLQAGERIGVHPAVGEWHDIGTIRSYLEAHRGYMSSIHTDWLVKQGNRLSGVVYIHPSARVSGSTLNNCVVLAETEIRNARLTSCVVQPYSSVVDRVLQDRLVARDRVLAFSTEESN